MGGKDRDVEDETTGVEPKEVFPIRGLIEGKELDG